MSRVVPRPLVRLPGDSMTTKLSAREVSPHVFVMETRRGMEDQGFRPGIVALDRFWKCDVCKKESSHHRFAKNTVHAHIYSKSHAHKVALFELRQEAEEESA